MALIRANTSGGGGTTIDWLIPTYSSDNKTITCNWDYDADCVIMVGKTGNNNTYWYIPTDTCKGYYATSAVVLTYDNNPVGLSATKRSITITKTYTFSDISIIPIPSKPTYYS